MGMADGCLYVGIYGREFSVKALSRGLFLLEKADYLVLGLLSISSLQIITHTDSTKVCAAQKNRKLSPSFLPATKKIKLMKKSRLVRIGDFRWECWQTLWDPHETISIIAV